MNFSRLLLNTCKIFDQPLSGWRWNLPLVGNNRREERRYYAQYSPSYIEPVTHPREQEDLSPDEIRELLHSKIKPPGSSQNASVFLDPLLAKFTNYVMKHGRKEKAREIISQAFMKIKHIQIRKYHLANDPNDKEGIRTDPLLIFHDAVQNSRPVIDLTDVKRGGVNYKVPIAIADHKSTFLAMKWILEAARDEPKRNKEIPWCGEHFSDRLAKELLQAANNTGRVVKRKIEQHKIAEANKAYAHFRWS